MAAPYTQTRILLMWIRRGPGTGKSKAWMSTNCDHSLCKFCMVEASGSALCTCRAPYGQCTDYMICCFYYRGTCTLEISLVRLNCDTKLKYMIAYVAPLSDNLSIAAPRGCIVNLTYFYKSHTTFLLSSSRYNLQKCVSKPR